MILSSTYATFRSPTDVKSAKNAQKQINLPAGLSKNSYWGHTPPSLPRITNNVGTDTNRSYVDVNFLNFRRQSSVSQFFWSFGTVSGVSKTASSSRQMHENVDLNELFTFSVILESTWLISNLRISKQYDTGNLHDISYFSLKREIWLRSYFWFSCTWLVFRLVFKVITRWCKIKSFAILCDELLWCIG